MGTHRLVQLFGCIMLICAAFLGNGLVGASGVPMHMGSASLAPISNAEPWRDPHLLGRFARGAALDEVAECDGLGWGVHPDDVESGRIEEEWAFFGACADGLAYAFTAVCFEEFPLPELDTPRGREWVYCYPTVVGGREALEAGPLDFRLVDFSGNGFSPDVAAARAADADSVLTDEHVPAGSSHGGVLVFQIPDGAERPLRLEFRNRDDGQGSPLVVILQPPVKADVLKQGSARQGDGGDDEPARAAVIDELEARDSKSECDDVAWSSIPGDGKDDLFRYAACSELGFGYRASCTNGAQRDAALLTPPDGKVWVMCNLNLMNLGPAPLQLNAFDFAIIDTNNLRHPVDFTPTAIAGAGALVAEELPSGQQVNRLLVFSVDDDAAKPLRLEWRPAVGLTKHDPLVIILDRTVDATSD